MKPYSCPQCQARIFFENMSCLSCGAELGYHPQADAMWMIAPSPVEQKEEQPSASQSTADATGQTQAQTPASARTSVAGAAGEIDAPHAMACANRTTAAACNWLIDAPVTEDGNAALCDCCRYTRTIPPLDLVENQIAWRNLEQAKRYLFYSLRQLNLPIPDRTQQPESGLAFDFLTQLNDATKVMTGHANGIITINIAEADDVVRERRRVALQESYRTVLGHLRHEIGHFYWDQLIAKNAAADCLPRFRELFGDERADYAQALKTHYAAGNDGTWRSNFVSYYASAHPWEDWAETWAHYLHVVDALDTAAAWQATIGDVSGPIQKIDRHIAAQQFPALLIEQWLPLSQYLNAACRSLGEADAYPFELPPAVVDKMTFVHSIVTGQEL